MKKILSVAVAAFMLVGSIFAIDFSVDGNFAIPLDFAKSETKSENTVLGVKTTYNRTTNSQEVGFGGDVGIKAMLTKNFGLKLDLGLYFPNSQSWKTTTVSTVNNTSSTTNSNGKYVYSDMYDSYTSFNLFVGPAIRLSNKKSYAICVTPGFSFDWRTAKVTSGDTTTPNKKTVLGFGAEFDARYNITKNIYLNAACPIIYQFKEINSNNDETKINALYVVPKIGLGYRF